jgi:hypothetical protein
MVPRDAVTQESVRDFERELLQEAETAGLALSGGGPRAAAFGLGVLQALAARKLLGRIDYLSSTGSGSLLAGWLIAWMRRSNFHEVEARLGDFLSGPEAEPIDTFRRAVYASQGAAGSSTAVLIWVRNVVLNLITLGALLAALLFLTDIGYYELVNLRFAGYLAPVFSVLAAVLLFSTTVSPASRDFAGFWRVGKFWSAVAMTMLAAALSAVATDSDPVVAWTAWWRAAAIAWVVFFEIAWLPRGERPSGYVGHVFSALVSGIAGGLLFGVVRAWLQLEFRPPAIAMAVVLTVLLYMFLRGLRISDSTREIAGRFCGSLAGLAALWLVIVMVWDFPIQAWVPMAAGAIVVIAGGLLRGFGVFPYLPLLRLPLVLMERLAPYALVLGLAAALRPALDPFVQDATKLPLELGITGGLLAVVLFLMWRLRTGEFTMHEFQRSHIARTFLRGGLADRSKPRANDDIPLEDFQHPSRYRGPYPLFGAALRDSDQMSPFVFSPLFSGTPDSLCPTGRFAGGISLGGAMAVCEPLRANSPEPSSPLVAFLWTLFDVRNGRWTGSPRRADTWNKLGPLLGPFYALRRGFTSMSGPPAYVRPVPAGEFDKLGLVELVKRRCRFIILCDSSADPNISFEALAGSLRRCRAEGAEVEIDTGPLGRSHSAHCQIGRIRYADGGPEGLLLYVKPSLTGDESSELGQYAVAHPDFPYSGFGQFGEAEFDSYRQLGEHVIQSVLDEQKLNRWEVSIEEFFGVARPALKTNLPPAFFEQPKAAPKAPAPAPPPPRKSEPPPAELVDLVVGGECVVCAGAGLAAQAGAPTWQELFSGLLRAARDQGLIDPQSADGLAASLAARELDAVADELTFRLQADFVNGYVVRTATGKQPSEAHKLITGMPFGGLLSLSLDDLLSKAAGSVALTSANAADLVAALRDKRPFVSNVFGAAGQPGQLIFTTKQFRALLTANAQFKEFLATLFLRCNVLFAGISLDGIRDFLDVIELPQVPERVHFALIPPAAADDAVKVRYLQRSYNIRVIEYQPGFNYAGLVEFFQQLQAAVGEQVPKQRSTVPFVLKHVHLENIGPFESLDLDLTTSWNILLGDNGVGKTVVLKAIAAALCGKDTETGPVERLLRAGTDSGLIRLKAQEEYTVKLQRGSDGKVTITPTSLSPMVYENALVLGFPALRAISWDRPKGPDPKRKASVPASAADLLPLLRGEPDSRISDIKQWLINLDWRSAQDARAGRQLQRFFEALQTLTQGLRIKLVAIDRESGSIIIETDSGKVPLETISQGTSSILCWIGTLIERLSEARRGDETALVLIDEIDAHMHPKWQQVFVDAFRSEFKNVQLIATTHSPFIVGNMNIAVGESEAAEAVDQVVVFVRDQQGVLSQMRWNQRLKGLRIDQIVTLPVFGLDSSRDNETADALKTYNELSLKDEEELTPEEQAKLEAAASILNMKSHPAETEEARRAYELIHQSAASQLADMPSDVREKVLNEVKLQTMESFTGEKRPE